MTTIFLYTVGRMRGQILGWGLSLALLAGYLLQFFSTFAEPETRGQLQALLDSYPPELMAFFGGATDLFTPAGFLHMEFFSYMPLILGIFAVLLGSGLLAGDEESGVLDLLLAYQVSRTAMFFGRALAFLLAMALILALCWLGMAVALGPSGVDLTPSALARPFFSLYALLALFGVLALALSMVLPSRRMAATAAGLVLVAGYFITSLANMDPDLKGLSRLSPLSYYQGGEAITELNLQWSGGLLLAALLLLLFAWQRFERRDIRVGGEAGWKLPILQRRRKAAQT
jgi:ABC-2 type transport system permease protein